MPCARHFLSKFSCFLKPMLSFRRQGRNRKGIDVIEYQCPHCNRILKVPEKFIGLEGACSFCGTRLTIPADVVASEPADPSSSTANGSLISGSPESAAHAAQTRLNTERLAKELEAERIARLEAEAAREVAEARILYLEKRVAEAIAEKSENVLSRAGVECMEAQLAQSRRDVQRLVKELEAERALRMRAEAACGAVEKEVRSIEQYADKGPQALRRTPIPVRPQTGPVRPATRARRFVSILILVLVVAFLLAVSLWRPSTESIRKIISPALEKISGKLPGPTKRDDASPLQQADKLLDPATSESPDIVAARGVQQAEPTLRLEDTAGLPHGEVVDADTAKRLPGVALTLIGDATGGKKVAISTGSDGAFDVKPSEIGYGAFKIECETLPKGYLSAVNYTGVREIGVPIKPIVIQLSKKPRNARS
jgi:hypothetical protein